MTVLDASAVLAFLGDEAGRDVVSAALADGGCSISAINWSEVCQKGRQHELPEAPLVALAELVDIVEVTRADGELAAQLWSAGSQLSIADRICMAVAIRSSEPVLTCDRAWSKVAVQDLEVLLAR